jgi:hypothetical protein
MKTVLAIALLLTVPQVLTGCSHDPSPKVFDCEVGLSERNVPISKLDKDKRINIVINMDPIEAPEHLPEALKELSKDMYKATIWAKGDDKLLGRYLNCNYTEEDKEYLCNKKVDGLNAIASIETDTGKFLFQSEAEMKNFSMTQTMNGNCEKR